MPYKDPEQARAYALAWNADNADYYRDKKARRRTFLKQMVADAKAGRPCSDCDGEFPPFCMDFDHRPGEVKCFIIARAPHIGVSVEKLRQEIAKCDLVCANCHRIRSAARGWPNGREA